MKEAHELYAAKMNRQLKAHLKGKRTKLTIPNHKEKETNRRWYNVSGFDFWGDPKAKPSQK